MAERRIRWQLAGDDQGQGALFAEEELVERHVGKGAYRGLEFLHVNARSIVNEVPVAARLPFRWTINAYRGCSHACTYCLHGDTPVLTADGRTKPIADVRPGDRVYGTVRQGSYRRYVVTEVLDHWSTVKPAYRVTLEDGTELLASGDHRFLTDRGWKHVAGAERPHLTVLNNLMGTGHFAPPPDDDEDYRRGYLSGLTRGDVYRFRLALTDFEALRRAKAYLLDAGTQTHEFLYQAAAGDRRALRAIRASARADVAAIAGLVAWPTAPPARWAKGFLAGIFDAEGSYSRGILRICNKDPVILDRIGASLSLLGFRFVVEPPRGNGVRSVRLLGGLREHLRFFHTVDPAITRKRSVEGTAIKGDAPLRVASVEPLGVDLPMYDITTGTGDFVANGVVSHNCFARPTHAWLDLDIGRDFERVIVVKVNAVERLRAELAARRWRGEPIAMGTNTDPYQKAEGKYHLTRGIVEALGERRNPFSILTKSTLILRDLDALTEAAARTDVRASFSIGTLDPDVWRLTEPGTPPPWKRVEAVARLNEAGIPCGVLVAPVLPGLSDRPEQLDAVVKACVEAGATSISPILLHLRPGVREHYLTWLAEARPDLLPLHDELYPKAYAPKDRQHELAALVRGMVRRHGGLAGEPGDHRRPAPRPRRRARPEAEAEAKAEPRQLPLGWG